MAQTSMAASDETTAKTIKTSENWCRLAVCTNVHVKRALVAILHNEIGDPTITALPSDPVQLFMFMVNNQNKLNRRFLKPDQIDQLFPHEKMVYTDKMDVTLVRYLILTFCNIVNEDGNWKQPRVTDHSIAAAVYRAASLRNFISHYKDIVSLDEMEFNDIWNEIECVLTDLRYTEDISFLKTQTFDPDGVRAAKKQFHDEIAEDFEIILATYKERCSKTQMPYFVDRQFVETSSNQQRTIENFENILINQDIITISAAAGLGKSYSARYIKYKWSIGEIFKDKRVVYFNSKEINKEMIKRSFAAPIFASELRDILKDKTEEYLLSFSCFKREIKDLLLIIDGADELSIEQYLKTNDLKKLEIKVENNEDISGLETIIAIYFGYLFPGSKIILLGRKNEIERLKNVKSFKKLKRADLELRPLSEEGVKELISRESCSSTSCDCNKCSHIYNTVKDVEFRNVPSHLVSLINVVQTLPNDNVGKLTKSKLLPFNIFNLLKNHTKTVIHDDKIKTFKRLLEIENTRKFADAIIQIAEMSFLSLLDKDVTIRVEERKEKDTTYLYSQKLSIERDVLEELDFFYIRDHEYFFLLEPYTLTTMEFFAACHVFCHPDQWNSLLYPKLSDDRQLIILPYLAGLHSSDNFNKDFVSHVLLVNSHRDVKDFLNWLFSITDVLYNLPLSDWYGLREDGVLFPSFDLLQRIRNEVEAEVNDEIANNFSTIVCYCQQNFEWYEMNNFNPIFLTHNTYKIESFLDSFNKYKFMIKHNISIENDVQFKLIKKMMGRDRVTFKLNTLTINAQLAANNIHNTHLKSNTLSIWSGCDSRTIDLLLGAISHTATTSTVKRLHISRINNFNEVQTKNLFQLCLNGVDILTLQSYFLSTKQITILDNIRQHQQINIQLYDIDFNDMFKLPDLSQRHVSLYKTKITDNQLIKLKDNLNKHHHYHNNFSKYKIINPFVPFIRKKDVTTVYNNQSFYLHLCNVNFEEVSASTFAASIARIPSLECYDEVNPIPSTHWKRLSQVEQEECLMNELRVWYPTLVNLGHILKIKTHTLQLVYYVKDYFIKGLNYIANNNEAINFNKTLKVFGVKRDFNDWDNDYEEREIFTTKPSEELKTNYVGFISLLNDTEFDSYHEGDTKWRSWCCEITDESIEKLRFGLSGDEDKGLTAEKEKSPLKQTRLQKLKSFVKRR